MFAGAFEFTYGASRCQLRKRFRKTMSETASPGDENDSSREEQLRRMVADYEARLTEVSDLAARVRHEINNPLTGLIGQAQLLLREELSDTARRRVQTIEHLANRIRDTVAELRDVQPPTSRTRDGQPGNAPPASEHSEGENSPPRH
jgi:signal transduction histidine kinase